MSAPTLTYRKADHRYYVSIDGEQAGWVSKFSNGTWSFYAPVLRTIHGEELASGCKTRRDAVMDGLAMLRIMHLGRVYKLEFSPVRDEPVYFEEADLKAVCATLMDEKYPMFRMEETND